MFITALGCLAGLIIVPVAWFGSWPALAVVWLWWLWSRWRWYWWMVFFWWALLALSILERTWLGEGLVAWVMRWGNFSWWVGGINVVTLVLYWLWRRRNGYNNERSIQ